MRLIGLLAMILVAMLPGALAAQENMGRIGTWVVEPYDPDQDIIDADRANNFRIASRILPLRLARNVEDIRGNNGKVLVLAGTQIVFVPPMNGLKNSEGIFCNARNIRNSSRELWRSGIVSNKLICFLDRDGDQAFESYIDCYSMSPNLLIDGKCHEGETAIPAARYELPPRTEFKTDMELHLRYMGAGTFWQCIGTNTNCLDLRGRISDQGQGLQWLGADFELLSHDENGARLKVQRLETPRFLNIQAPWVLFKVWM
jgi:hypothetical protein